MAVAVTEGDLRRFIAGPYASVVAAVAFVTGSRAAAEDAVHEALARAWEKGDIEHLDRWVLTVALNVSRSRWRKDRRETRLAGTPDRSAVDRVPDVDLERAVAELPRRQREVVVLHYLLGWPVAHIAAALHLSDGGVKHALFRARRSLAAALTPDPVEEVAP